MTRRGIDPWKVLGLLACVASAAFVFLALWALLPFVVAGR